MKQEVSAKPTGTLAKKLREETKTAHRDAERAPFIMAFLKGQAPRGAYAAFIARLRPVYAALEVAFTKCQSQPLLRPFYTPELWRSPALERDLAYFYGSQWDPTELPEAAKKYVAHIERLQQESPYLLIAHSYTRYLGDLSGGQILAKVARKNLELSADQGLAFYEFPEIADQQQYKQDYRDKLNALQLSPSQEQSLVKEACLAFELSTELSNDVWKLFVDSASQSA